MKTDFSVSIQVSIGVTPEVVQLVTAILTKQQPTAVVLPNPASNEPQPQGTATGKKPRKTKTDAAPANDADAGDQAEAQEEQQQPADQPGEAEAEAPVEESPKQLTEEDIREAMHLVRQRIEGENYKENTDSEGYKKYHRILTQTFKNISALLGSDKPSTLPADKRADFINEINALIVNEKGEIAKPEAF